jgi:single-stranded-DNA-specific exonuclease
VVDVACSALGRSWRLRTCDEALALSLSQRHGLDAVVARVMAARGVALEAASLYLEPRLRDLLPDPSHLLDLDLGAARIADAIQTGEQIGAIADYDVDGATSAALLIRYLRALGIEAVVEIPDRIADGYGPNGAALARLAARGCRLVLTLDTGTLAFEPLAEAAHAGQEVIVVDHHMATAQLPAAFAVINPNRLDQTSPLTHLAAVGVTFVLLVAVNRELRRRGFFRHRAEPSLMAWLDLVALGTVCDVVPLAGLNRAFVRQGLKVLGELRNPGLAALARMAGLGPVQDAWQLGFALGPRINAGGRIGRSDLGARLLGTDCPSEADGLAQRLHELNIRRQAMEREQLAIAEQQIAEAAGAGEPVLIAASDSFHPGVVGILASRLVERFHRPVFVIAMDETGTGKGSARSVPAFDLGSAVLAARDEGLIERGGGHPMAAGVTIKAESLPAFAAHMRARAQSACPDPPRPAPLELDAALAATGVTPDLACQLERLAPFGAGNTEPIFAVADACVREVRHVGDVHLGCVISGRAGGYLRGVAFRARGGRLGAMLEQGTDLRLAGRIKVDRWQGREGVSFQIEDAAAAS